MVRSYDELNSLEKVGLKGVLRNDGWDFCSITQTMSKKIDSAYISVEMKNFCVDED